jgi:hypothetical protein
MRSFPVLSPVDVLFTQFEAGPDAWAGLEKTGLSAYYLPVMLSE